MQTIFSGMRTTFSGSGILPRHLIFLALFSLTLSGCGVLPEQESYEDTPTGKELEIPPNQCVYRVATRRLPTRLASPPC